jgi:hypothetical protein
MAVVIVLLNVPVVAEIAAGVVLPIAGGTAHV